MWTRRLWGLGARLVGVVTVLLVPAVTVPAAALFTPVAPSPAIPAAALALRSRVVTMDLGQVQAARGAVAVPPAPGPHPPPVGSVLPGSVPAPRTPPLRPGRAAAASAPGTTLTLNLFEDRVVTARVEQTAPTFSGGYSVAGRIVGEPLGTLTLVVNGATVVGTVRLPGETYRIRSMGDGLYTISEVDEPPLTCGVEGPHAETDHPH